MAALTLAHFREWMEEYGRASKENDPQASADLFAPDAEYYETPFSEPMVGQEAIYHYWEKGARNLKDKVSSYEILALKENLGIARWQAKFVNANTGNLVELDCLFLVEFGEDRKCRLFREWWHSRVIEPNTTTG